MKLTLAYVFLLIFMFSTANAQNQVVEKDGVYYFADRLIIKFNRNNAKSNFGEITLSEKVAKRIAAFGVYDVKPFSKNYSKSNTSSNLDLITEAKFSSPMDPFYVSSKLSALPEIDYAEPWFLYELAYETNDPFKGNQYALNLIKASAAWDVTTGDTNVVIGIVDTGVDWDHPDLSANIWRNRGEIPNNGIDDDNNGFVDDIRGWDFGGLTGTPDNNPTEDDINSQHGTHVAGIAGAVTNNSIGISSISFKTKIMPVKTAQENIRSSEGQILIAYGYQGIEYAANNGAKVINCSWGGFGYSATAKSYIDYAISKGALVVAAAGNDNLEDIIYPAAYDGVLSVGSSTNSDSKSSFSNYGINLDVMAPGSSIYSTYQNNTYQYAGGTSMASPLVAGLAGLVASVFPDFSPLELGEQVRVTSDNIENLNPAYPNLLGYGRVNALNAVTKTNAVSVRSTNINITENGNGDGVFVNGEGGFIELDFLNVLNATTNLSLELTTNISGITISNPSLNIGSVGSGSTFNNSSNRFAFSIGSSVGKNVEVNFLLKYTDSGYNDFQGFNLIVNPEYITQTNGGIKMTITSKGTLGFNDYPNNLQGDGFIYNDYDNFLFEGALMYGTKADKIVSSARDNSGEIQDEEFEVITPFSVSIPGTRADQEGYTVFDDSKAMSDSYSIETELRSYSFSGAGEENFIIIEYTFVNKSQNIIEGFYAGLYFDWDIPDAGDNIAGFDDLGDFGFVTSNSGDAAGIFAGATQLTGTQTGYYAINNGGDNRGFGVYDGFTEVEKWQALSGGIAKTQAGPYDVSSVISSGPYNFGAFSRVKVAFVIAAGDDQNSLAASISTARQKYSTVTSIGNEIPTKPIEFSLSQNYPNPFNPKTTIKFSIPEHVEIVNTMLKVYDVLGNEISTLVNESKPSGSYEVDFDASKISSGIYYYKLTSGSFSETKKMILLK